MENLEKDRDALLQSMSEMVPGALENLDGEEKNKLYHMLRLEVTPSEEGYEVSGAFCTSGHLSPLPRRKVFRHSRVGGRWTPRTFWVCGRGVKQPSIRSRTLRLP